MRGQHVPFEWDSVSGGGEGHPESPRIFVRDNKALPGGGTNSPEIGRKPDGRDGQT